MIVKVMFNKDTRAATNLSLWGPSQGQSWAGVPNVRTQGLKLLERKYLSHHVWFDPFISPCLLQVGRNVKGLLAGAGSCQLGRTQLWQLPATVGTTRRILS